MFKNLLKIIIVLLGFLSTSKNLVALDKPIKTRIYVSKVVDHPALNNTCQGIIDTLTEAGFIEGENLDFRVESAQANPALAQQIATKFLSANPDILVGLGTLSAQSFTKAALAGQIKMVFSSITDPVAAHLVENLKKPNRSISGVSNFVPLEPQIELMRKILPKLKTIGILYNQGEANSKIIADQLENILKKYQITLIKQTVTKTADIPQATQKLLGHVEALFVSNDNTVLSAIRNVIQLALRANVPVFVSDTDLVEQGALAALGPNQYKIGRQTGEMILRVLKGAKLEEQAVEMPSGSEIYLNKDQAHILGLKFSLELQEQAQKIFPIKELGQN